MNRIQLTITEGEADFLQALMASIGGSRTRSPRKYADRIAKALQDVTGQSYNQTDAHRLKRHGHLVFATYDEDSILRERGKTRPHDPL